MKFTGERPTLEHEVESSRLRYKNILPHCRGKLVLDFGCGMGQGSYFLSRFASMVVGYDPDLEALQEAERVFAPRLNLQFTTAWERWSKLVDLVTAVEVIEHMEQHDLVDLLGTLEEAGVDFTGTTPDGDLLPYDPKTPEERRGFHVKHWRHVDLEELLSQYFAFVDLSGHAFDPRLGRFTGYTFFCSSSSPWDKRLLKQVWHPDDI
jgi:SAM-dependent methyltransferase